MHNIKKWKLTSILSQRKHKKSAAIFYTAGIWQLWKETPGERRHRRSADQAKDMDISSRSGLYYISGQTQDTFCRAQDTRSSI